MMKESVREGRKRVTGQAHRAQGEQEEHTHTQTAISH